MYPNSISDIMILAQAVLQLFGSQGWKAEKGDNSVKHLQNFAKS